MIHINEIGTAAERITQLVNHFCQGNKTAFGRAADIQSGVLAGIIGGRESKPGFEILQKLLTGYPSVSPDWLLFGRGEMLRGAPHSAYPTSQAGALDQLVLRYMELSKQLELRRAAYREIVISSVRVQTDLEQVKASLLAQTRHVSAFNPEGQILMEKIIEETKVQSMDAQMRYDAFTLMRERAEEEMLRALSDLDKLETQINSLLLPG